MDASDADAMPLPSEDTTPPVTKISEVMVEPFVESDILTARPLPRERCMRQLHPTAKLFTLAPIGGWPVAGGDFGVRVADKSGFFEELKRRHVWRTAVTYAVAGWLIVLIATQVFPFFNIPNADVRLVVVLIAIGFPIALTLAWAYEITPEGIRHTEPAGSPAARPEHESRQIGRKLNTLTIAILIV
ncbi:MAG: hypothetical protein ACREPJ_12850, partial [Rhodanobacteraceae bacterium]